MIQHIILSVGLLWLGFLIASDFRTREVNLMILILLGATMFCLSILLHGFFNSLFNIATNLVLLLFLSLSLMTYYYAVYRNVRMICSAVGIGDLLFFLLLTPLFSLRSYLFFTLASSGLSILWWGGYRTLYKKNTTVPFIGTSGIVLGVYLFHNIYLS